MSRIRAMAPADWERVEEIFAAGIDPVHRGQGIGRALLDAFIAAAEDAGYWTIQSSIFPENTASLRLHESAGLRIVGTRERISRSLLGPHAGQWRDTVLIERRSTRNGTP